MTGALIVLVVALLALLVVLTHVRRRAIRTHLLRHGMRSAAQASLVRRGRATRVAIRYRDVGGVERRALKVQSSVGDGNLVMRPAQVLHDPRRPASDEYVLVGFGHFPARWFSVQFDRKAA